MSTRSSYSRLIGLGRESKEATGTLRALAVVSGILLTYSYISVLLHITDVVGGTEVLLTAIVGSVVLAVVVSRFISLRGALIITAGMVITGYIIYIISLPDVYVAFLNIGRVMDDTLSLLTGVSVLRITEADMWALGIGPGPTFFTWYLIIKRRYVWATVVGGLTLGFFVLTGDASLFIALAGVIGGAGLVGFGTAERVGATWKHVDLVVAILVLMVVIPTLVSAVPGNIAQDGSGGTIESTLINANERIPITGSISLSPEVRFTVTSEEPDYWRVAAYNRQNSR
ncbi:MAG: hypothetical protein SV377_06475 [Halobacteria archaeon]|nr:hypothetical protein [Halobacteria archaeon]